MYCDYCSGEVGILGVLGNMCHFLCRNCGAQYGRILTEDEELEMLGIAEEDEDDEEDQ